MLLETLVTGFIAGFALLVLYGHVLLLQALLTPQDANTRAERTRATDERPGADRAARSVKFG